jgi:Na+-translocating ferredoxin:NAD+ oxidoreductase RnfC subunit
MPDIISAREVTLLLSQHIGAVAMPVVSIGQSVKQGELVAAIPAGAALGANLHASIDGVVTAVNAAITIQKDPPQGG